MYHPNTVTIHQKWYNQSLKNRVDTKFWVKDIPMDPWDWYVYTYIYHKKLSHSCHVVRYTSPHGSFPMAGQRLVDVTLGVQTAMVQRCAPIGPKQDVLEN